MVNLLGQTNSLVNQFVSEIRDAEIQKDASRFRLNLERLGSIFAYEISKNLAYETREVVTSLGFANVPILVEYPVLATILRAGLPFHQGFLRFFDRSDNAFVSAYRKYHKDHSYTMAIEYTSSPDLNDRTVILCDPMLATGISMVLSYKELLAYGTPKHVHFASILASQQGLSYLKKNIPSRNATVWLGTVDDELTAQAYIVPGLGDAGDLAFGKKNG
jgi:uracil phosphoribosyltransferase